MLVESYKQKPAGVAPGRRPSRLPGSGKIAGGKAAPDATGGEVRSARSSIRKSIGLGLNQDAQLAVAPRKSVRGTASLASVPEEDDASPTAVNSTAAIAALGMAAVAGAALHEAVEDGEVWQDGDPDEDEEEKKAEAPVRLQKQKQKEQIADEDDEENGSDDKEEDEDKEDDEEAEEEEDKESKDEEDEEEDKEDDEEEDEDEEAAEESDEEDSPKTSKPLPALARARARTACMSREFGEDDEEEDAADDSEAEEEDDAEEGGGGEEDEDDDEEEAEEEEDEDEEEDDD